MRLVRKAKARAAKPARLATQARQLQRADQSRERKRRTDRAIESASTVVGDETINPRRPRQAHPEVVAVAADTNIGVAAAVAILDRHRRVQLAHQLRQLPVLRVPPRRPIIHILHILDRLHLEEPDLHRSIPIQDLRHKLMVVFHDDRACHPVAFQIPCRLVHIQDMDRLACHHPGFRMAYLQAFLMDRLQGSQDLLVFPEDRRLAFLHWGMDRLQVGLLVLLLAWVRWVCFRQEDHP